MFLRRRASRPMVPRSNMFLQRILNPLLAIEVLAICSARHRVVVPKQTSASELGQQKLDNVFERLREERVGLAKDDQPAGCGRRGLVGLTKLKPSTPASSTQISRPSATCEGVPTITGPLPPMLTCSATVCLVHFELAGENRALDGLVWYSKMRLDVP